MNIQLKQGIPWNESTDFLVVSHYKGDAFVHLKPVEGMLDKGFEGNANEWSVLPTYGKLKPKKIGIVGLGERSKCSLDDIRKFAAHSIKQARQVKAKHLTIAVPPTELAGRELGIAIAEGLLLGAYYFHQYKGKASEAELKRVKDQELNEIFIYVQETAKRSAVEKGIEIGRAFAHGTIVARDLVNTPPNDMMPSALVEAAKKCVTKGSGISMKVLDQKTMEKLGMRAALAVAQGSNHPAAGAHLIYKPKGKAKKKIILVGKAVTFDSGGLSIKPSDGMMTMKCDMAGAAAVIGLFHTLPVIAPNVEVHGIFLGVENMLSGSSYRPGDVVKAMNGVTIEVLNTDAEGRVTLADALSYAEKFKPDAIIDLATLTGACVVALGEDMAAYMGNDPKLLDKVGEAGKIAGEAWWELPLFQPYKELIKSKVADIKNIGGGRWGGAITAGLFLSYFVGKTPWVHMDIAGPAFAEKETRPDTQFGGTGFAVRTLARYLQGA